MRRQVLAMVPVAGLFALACPVSAGASGVPSNQTLAQSQLPLVLAQQQGGANVGSAVNRGPSAAAPSRSGPTMSRGDSGNRSISRGDGDRGRAVRVDRDGDRSRVVRGDRDNDRTRAVRRDRDGDRGGHDRGWIRSHGHRYVWGPGIEFFFYDGYYYGDCAWLRRRAVETGSSYWWRRYRQCRVWG